MCLEARSFICCYDITQDFSVTELKLRTLEQETVIYQSISSTIDKHRIQEQSRVARPPVLYG